MGKILGNKELGDVRSEAGAFPVDGLDALRTVPVWAFHFLSKGCSSQFRGIFLWGLWKRLRQMPPPDPMKSAFCEAPSYAIVIDVVQSSFNVRRSTGRRSRSNATR